MSTPGTPDPANVSACKACGQPMLWVVMKDTGAWMPLDPDVVTLISPEGEVIQGHRPHWMTCTNPGRFRRRGQGR